MKMSDRSEVKIIACIVHAVWLVSLFWFRVVFRRFYGDVFGDDLHASLSCATEFVLNPIPFALCGGLLFLLLILAKSKNGVVCLLCADIVCLIGAVAMMTAPLLRMTIRMGG